MYSYIGALQRIRKKAKTESADQTPLLSNVQEAPKSALSKFSKLSQAYTRCTGKVKCTHFPATVCFKPAQVGCSKHP